VSTLKSKPDPRPSAIFRYSRSLGPCSARGGKKNPAAAKVLATAGGSRGSHASAGPLNRWAPLWSCCRSHLQAAPAQSKCLLLSSRLFRCPFSLACRRSASAPILNLPRPVQTPSPKSEKPTKKTRPPPRYWRRRVGVVVQCWSWNCRCRSTC